MPNAQPVAFALREGEYVYPWGRRFDVAGRVAGHCFPTRDAARFHCVFFDDGSCLDFVNGWRPQAVSRETVAEIRAFADENFLRDFP
jgi:hypothetical protein